MLLGFLKIILQHLLQQTHFFKTNFSASPDLRLLLEFTSQLLEVLYSASVPGIFIIFLGFNMLISVILL